MWVVDWKKLQMQACRLRCHTVDVTPPQATTKIMAGMAEQQMEWRNQMADGMVEWQEWREWQNGRKNGRWQNCRLQLQLTKIRMADGMAEWQKEWQNGRMAGTATYVLFMVHADNDTLIFYSIERRPWQNGVPDRHVGNKLSFQVNWTLWINSIALFSSDHPSSIQNHWWIWSVFLLSPQLEETSKPQQNHLLIKKCLGRTEYLINMWATNWVFKSIERFESTA